MTQYTRILFSKLFESRLLAIKISTPGRSSLKSRLKARGGWVMQMTFHISEHFDDTGGQNDISEVLHKKRCVEDFLFGKLFVRSEFLQNIAVYLEY